VRKTNAGMGVGVSMRTQKEIADKVRGDDSMFGFMRDALLGYLDFEHAREWLKPETTAEDWEKSRGASRDEVAVRAELADYMEFAWGKVEDHRGLSAGRSVEKCSAWAWLIGDDALEAKIEAAEYRNYGAPKRAVICQAFGLPIPEDEGAQRMIRSEACSGHCEGCG